MVKGEQVSFLTAYVCVLSLTMHALPFHQLMGNLWNSETLSSKRQKLLASVWDI